MRCKCSKTLKRLQLSPDISAHEEFIITLFSSKLHAVQCLKFQTSSQASTLLINCILITYCLAEYYKRTETVWATLQDNNWITVNKQTCSCTKLEFNIKWITGSKQLMLITKNLQLVKKIQINCIFKLAKGCYIQTHTRFCVNLLITNGLNWISRGRQQEESFLQ